MSYDALFDRRAFLAVTGGAMAAVALPLGALAGVRAQGGLLIGIEEAGDLAAAATEIGAVLHVMARSDDPVRFWRREIAPELAAGAPLNGVTLWSDYLVFRGLAAEAGLKLEREQSVAIAGGPQLIAWRFA